MVFPGIDEVVNIPGIIQVVERVAIRKADKDFAFPGFRNVIHSAKKGIIKKSATGSW